MSELQDGQTLSLKLQTTIVAFGKSEGNDQLSPLSALGRSRL